MTSEEEIVLKKPKACLGVRHLQTLMLFLALILAYGMRVNMSMAIVAMTDSDNENSYDWNSQRQSVILSSFFWGYIILQIPGGVMAARFGSKILFILSIGINSAISLLIPLSAEVGGWQLVCTCRVLQGLFQGFLYPAMHNTIGKWIPLQEKSRLGTFIYAGAHLGTALQLLVSGYIAQYFGWPAIFYTNGILGVTWTIIYMFIGSSSPKTSGIISVQEKRYIETSLGQIGEQKKLKTPWKAIWTSVPFISLICAHCSQNWGFWTLLTETPSYMKQVLGVDITANGIMSALPFLALYVISIPFGIISDYTLKKQWISITASRKISNSIGQWGPAIALIGLSYAPADPIKAVAILTAVVGLSAGHYTGFMLVHIDMSPNFAGSLMGITNFFANIVSIIAPLIAGLILTDQTDPDLWRIVFYLSSGVYLVGNLIYVVFGTSKIQKWNDPESNEDAVKEDSPEKMEKV